jgi:hypothetical protein
MQKPKKKQNGEPTVTPRKELRVLPLEQNDSTIQPVSIDGCNIQCHEECFALKKLVGVATI